MQPDFMREAIALAQWGMEHNKGGPFGAVIVKDGQVIGRGYNRVPSDKDPTAHAEINAIRDACQHIGDFSLRGCTIYTSCEPCPMCLSALYWARIDSIVYACSKADADAIGFIDQHIGEELSRPPEQRQIPMEQYLRQEAIPLFEQWQNKQDKTPY